MSSSNHPFTFPIYAMFFVVLVQTVIGADPLFHFCSSSGNFTAKSPYDVNLNGLLRDLYLKTPRTGFGIASVGQYGTRPYGLSLCRGDVSSKDCATCVVDASSEIRKRCPSNKGAVIWYDHCLLKYSDSDFFGKVDNQNRFYMWNLNNVSNPVSFNHNVKGLLSSLSEEAYVKPTLYATGESEIKGAQKLYGLVQCTRDLSTVDCKTCLDNAINELPSCCDGKEGGRVVGGSCNFRYEIYPFINT